jgi:hypothetical protein
MMVVIKTMMESVNGVSEERKAALRENCVIKWNGSWEWLGGFMLLGMYNTVVAHGNPKFVTGRETFHFILNGTHFI